MDDLDALRPDLVLVGGDIAQGAPAPEEVIDLLRRRRWPSVIGNADAFVLDIADGMVAPGAPGQLVQSARWSLDRLGSEHVHFLRNLPGALRIVASGAPEVTLVHATPWSVEEIVLRDAPAEVATRMVEAARTPIVAYGHIHSPYRRRFGSALLFSAGAVSGSNDRDPRPAYSVLTLSPDPMLEVRRVPFDAGAAVAAMRASGAPVSENLLQAMLTGGPWEVAPT
jgi:predicted phosphodiesterase